MCSYLGWEQEFFVMPADLYKARPDLVNCGRTLFGKLPTRHQQGDLNYFQPVPGKVQENPVKSLQGREQNRSIDILQTSRA